MSRKRRKMRTRQGKDDKQVEQKLQERREEVNKTREEDKKRRSR